MSLLLKNARIVTGEACKEGCLVVEDGRISALAYGDDPIPECDETIDLQGLCLMAGTIDAHVHFREPGLTAKADIESESRAALLGGVTSFVEMPNTNPPTVSLKALQAKLDAAKGRSSANYAFYIGATDSNYDELIQAEACAYVPGIKVFMGSSTGGMLVERGEALERIFALGGKPVLVHSEDEGTIRRNMEAARSRFGEDVPFSEHPEIRSREACIRSTIKALEMAMRLGTRLHLLHVSTAEEAEMVRAAKIHNPGITAETSANYLWFCDEDYPRLKGRVKCNPAIKSSSDREALRKAVAEGTIDTIGSDHAPHLAAEKEKPYFSCPSGVPSVAESLPVLLTLVSRGVLELPRIASLMAERPAEILGIKDRGFLRKGAIADLVVFDPDEEHVLSPSDIGYKCGWSPYLGESLKGRVKMVFLGGRMVVKDGVILSEKPEGQALEFNS